MRVLMITPYFAPEVGGVENYVLATALGLKKVGWDVFVITSQKSSKKILEEEVHGLTVFRLPVHFKLSNTPVSAFWRSQISEIIKKIKPDVVNAHTPVPYISDVGIDEALKLRVPSVLTYHNDLFKENPILQLIGKMYYGFLGDKSLRNAKVIVTTSLVYAENSEHLRNFKKKTSIIPPGIYPNKLLPRKNIYQKPYVIFVGTLDRTHRHKGVDFLLEAFKELHQNYNELGLTIVGKGDDLQHYKELVAEYHLQDVVTFKSNVSNEELPELYANALCLCLPSISIAEGFGMVILEAAQQMTPSIGSDIGGISQSIVKNKTGLLFPAKNPHEISVAILKLYKDPVLRKKLGENAYQRVMKEFPWDVQVKKTSELLKSVIK